MRDQLKINERISSQIPALRLLAKLGYQTLSPAQALKARDNNFGNVLLEDILREQLNRINRIHHKGQEYLFSEANIQEAIQKLKHVKYERRLKTHEAIYDLLTLPISLKQTLEGHSRSFDLHYIDWENIENNVFHAVPEFEVERTNLENMAKPDIVLFVNGIPLCVIECKSPNDGVEDAISQNIRNQSGDYIPKLFSYVQLILGTNKNAVRYATTDTKKNFWSRWQEHEDKEEDVQALINKPLSAEQEDAVFCDEFAQYHQVFASPNNQDGGLITEQDKAIYSLCRPERLLDLTHRFIIFEHSIKKIARYQQFFVVRNALKRSKQYRDNKRKGGIIWHTQGSGKSLTMVMLARALLLDKEIPNPRILLVTDRTDLDEQLGNTFKACGLEETKKATSGRDLIEHLKGEASIITTLIHKFDKALNAENYINDSANIFALVDESHRTNYDLFATRMRKMLLNACYIGFTGTPLLKEERNSLARFGGLIKPNYSTRQAVDDKAILPLLYEGRLADIKQDKKAIDKWFERHTRDLTDEQKADLKRKYARANVLNESDQVIYMRAYDISKHFRKNWQGTGFKAQLVAPGKLAAIKYHECLQDIGYVTSEVVISSPDTRRGYEGVDDDPTDRVVRFWNRMMKLYGSGKEYEQQIIGQFKDGEEPEIIIVVDKLLTGFDAPRNTVLYLCKKLREHTLLQAVARVNRLYEDKEFGYVIDYDNVLEELDTALTMYDVFKEFDEVDLAEALKAASEEVDKLPQKHSDLWATFRGIDKNDQEAMERFLADKEKRDEFYECLTAYGNTLAIALSNDKFLREVSNEELNRYRDDLKNFLKLRKSVQLRYAEIVDFGIYEKRIEKLLDAHIHADDVLQLNEPINILDRQSVASILEDSPYGSLMSTAAKADAIAHATQKTINEKMDEDPAFYQKFSKLIQKAIDDFKKQRISDNAYLYTVKDAKDRVASNVRDDVPDSIKENGDACAYYGVIKPQFEKSVENELAEKVAAEISLFIQDALDKREKVDFWHDTDSQKSVENDIDDYLHDEVKAKFDIALDGDQMDEIISKVMDIARSRSHA